RRRRAAARRRASGRAGRALGPRRVAVRVRLVPGPGVGDHRLDLRFARLPAEHAPDLGRGGDELRRVARAALLLGRLDVNAGHLAGGVDHLADGEAVAVAEVKDAVHARLGRPDRADVRVREVLDVDVVADRGAVARRVV